jgi:ribonuclease P protein component
MRAGVLRRPVEFEAVLRSGLRVSTRNFVARALRNPLDQPRLGLIAGKKAAPRAVDRNRAKRLVREVFRARSKLIGPFDVTIQLRANLRSQNNDTVRAELDLLFDTLGKRCATGTGPVRATAEPAAGVPGPSSVSGTASHRQH